ncbi:hypothetical protein MLD38_005845 [Melastoma candidum]|uniref:Uncharacterized protein n=1 Tax=Melastoma candidum TaxID=119954 RepID=A0ACB9RLK2_9MYRT|nr:hypothetical protein MLD38_005845 [Melastoma candidum]
MMEGDAFGSGNAQVGTKALQSFQRSFVQVQSILDQNRLLINEISQNQESRVPDGLTRNVVLIRELNNNIRRVVDLYTDLSINFSRSAEATAGAVASEGDSTVRSDPRAIGGLKRNRPA